MAGVFLEKSQADMILFVHLPSIYPLMKRKTDSYYKTAAAGGRSTGTQGPAAGGAATYQRQRNMIPTLWRTIPVPQRNSDFLWFVGSSWYDL